MKITYNPTADMADKLNKYGVQFVKGEASEVPDNQAEKFLAIPYFSGEAKKAAPKKKTVKNKE